MSKRALWVGSFLAGLPALAAAQPLAGPYVSLGAGVNLQQNEIVAPAPSLGFNKNVIYTFHPGFAGKVSVGYGLGNGVRIEIEGDYLTNVVRGAQENLPLDNRPRRAGGLERKYGGFVNVLYDADLGLPFKPYVGIGAGALAVEHNGFNQSVEGVTLAPLIVPGAPPAGFHDQTVGGFAYQGIAGLSVPLPWVPGLSFTTEYHFVGLLDPLPAFQLNVRREEVVGPPTFFPGNPHPFYLNSTRVAFTGNRHFENDLNHEIVLGFRYALFQPPAPLPPQAPPPPVASPVPPAARTYLVFFDWDRADLTARARQIVAQAAQASQHGTTQLQVDGYTDLSGTAAYNQRLSVRRAATVKAELVRDGVPAGEIAIAGHGENNPLVPTAPGVREPQNRRVEIVLR